MIKKPLVIGAQGQIQQLQPTDAIPASPIISAMNGDGTSHTPGTVVFVSSGTTVQAAQANSYTSVRASAVAIETIAPGASGIYQYEGVVPGFVGLSPGSTYFLSPTVAGQVTVTPPSANGEWVMQVGQAFSDTEISIDLGQPIQL